MSTGEQDKDREKQLRDPELFRAALRTGDNYLGDPETVEALVRLAVADYAKILNSDDAANSRENKIVKLALSNADILLGKDKDFDVVPGWNKAGVIDRFCQKWLGTDPSLTDPRDTMMQAFVKLFAEIGQVANFAGEDGVLDSQWEPAVREIVDRYVGVFRGVDLPTQAILR